MSQATDLHRALLRPAIIHTLRATGFHSTRHAVLDTLTNVAERYLLLLATTTARHAYNSHNDAVPTITDVRMALTDCGIILPDEGASEEEWRELMRLPIEDMGKAVTLGGGARMRAEKRKREEEDVKDVVEFKRWFSGGQHNEIRRVAGMIPDTTTGSTALPIVGVGGGVVQADDFLTTLRKKHGKAGDDDWWQGTVLGQPAEDKEVLVEGGPVQGISDWRPRVEEKEAVEQAGQGAEESGGDSSLSSVSSVTVGGDSATPLNGLLLPAGEDTT